MKNNYYQLSIEVKEDAIREQLVALLADAGWEGFEEIEAALHAFISAAEYQENGVKLILSKYNLKYSLSIISEQNWNALWEAGFSPVQVDDFVGIRAAFHEPIEGVQHEIIITPKMSFGTGHHATTFLVMQLMQAIDFIGKSAYDFGTGTGILAILAEKLGATRVLAVDHDDWCIENSSENILVNKTKYIDIQKVSDAKIDRIFDVVLANVNRHIIIDNIDYLEVALMQSGFIILSGLLQSDETEIIQLCNSKKWNVLKVSEKSGWIALLCQKA